MVAVQALELPFTPAYDASEGGVVRPTPSRSLNQRAKLLRLNSGSSCAGLRPGVPPGGRQEVVGRAVRQGPGAAHAEAPPRGRGRGERAVLSHVLLHACMVMREFSEPPGCILQKEVFKDLDNYGLCARSRVLLGK